MTISEAKQLIAEIRCSGYAPNYWEIDFLHSIECFLDRGFTLTEKQAACLQRTHRKANVPSQYRQQTQTPYDVLGIKESASKADINKAYHKLVLTNHPDKVATLDPEIVRFATERMQRINAAYDVLNKR